MHFSTGHHENHHAETNGHQPGLPELKEQLRTLRAQKAIKKLQAEVKILEAFSPSFTDNQFGGLVDPFDAFRDADSLRAFPIGNRDDRKDGRNRPFVWADLDLDYIRGQARWLETRNPIAQGIITNLRNFTIKTGYKWEAQPTPRKATDKIAIALADQVQVVIDDFSDINMLPLRERSALVRSVVNGESIMRFFAQEDGTTLTRWIEPEQIRQPLGSPPNWLFGVETDPYDIEQVIGYAVAYHDPNDWEYVPAGDVAFLKRNVPENVKRGVSDFFSTADALDGTWKLIRNMRESGAAQAAIAWIEQFDAANQATVQASVQAARDQNRTYYPQAVTGKDVNYQRMEPGTVVKTGKGRTYVPAPLAANTTQHVSIAQASLRALGCRWALPEFMVSGDASNNNFASILVAGSPVVNAIECEQDVYRWYFLRWRWTAVRNAARAGRFVVNGRVYTEHEIQALVDIHGTPPQVAISNKQEDATIDKQDLETGVTSVQTIRAKRGLDNDKIRQDRKEEPPPAPQGAGPGDGPPEAPANKQGAAPGGAASSPGFFPRRSA